MCHGLKECVRSALTCRFREGSSATSSHTPQAWRRRSCWALIWPCSAAGRSLYPMDMPMLGLPCAASPCTCWWSHSSQAALGLAWPHLTFCPHLGSTDLLQIPLPWGCPDAQTQCCSPASAPESCMRLWQTWPGLLVHIGLGLLTQNTNEDACSHGCSVTATGKV